MTTLMDITRQLIDQRPDSFFAQRINIDIQRGIAASLQDTFRNVEEYFVA